MMVLLSSSNPKFYDQAVALSEMEQARPGYKIDCELTG